MSEGFDAAIIADWPRGVVRLSLRERRPGSRPSFLMRDGTWQEVDVELATVPGDIGLDLPAEAIEAIAHAIRAWQGRASDADTEARVLREWLTIEQRRVDAMLRQTVVTSPAQDVGHG